MIKITTFGIIGFILYSLFVLWVLYEIWRAPLMDDDGKTVIEKTKRLRDLFKKKI